MRDLTTGCGVPVLCLYQTDFSSCHADQLLNARDLAV